MVRREKKEIIVKIMKGWNGRFMERKNMREGGNNEKFEKIER